MNGYRKPSVHDVPERVDVRATEECWTWLLSIGSHGYGQVGWCADGRRSAMTTAHRVAWIATNGPIPVGMTIDHVCRNPACCNPSHLRLLTNAENARDNRQAQRGPGRRSYRDEVA